MQSGAQLIDHIVYTASLATNSKEIDPLLDPLREITARTPDPAALSEADRATLLQVRQSVEQYLFGAERVRSFTPESLATLVKQHEAGDSFKKSRAQLQVIIVTAFSLALGLALLLPLETVEQRGLVGGATAFSLLTVGAASLFLTALPAFQSQLRRAFFFICAGVTLLGLSLLGQPVMEIFNLRQYPLTSVLYTLPIFIAALLFHTGNILFARLVGVRNWWTTPWPVVIGGAVLALLSWVAPHAPTNEPELLHDIVASIWGIMLLTPCVSTVALRMTMSKMSEIYKTPIRRLFWAMFPIIVVVAYQFILRVFAGPYMQGIAAYVLFSIVTVMGLALIHAGYSFNKVSRY